MQFRELTERYQLQKILKSTRFGTVLRATDLSSGRTVIVKLVTIGPSPGLAAGAPEFEKLAATLVELGHPNLPTVLDFGFTSDGSAFLVMEPLEGNGLDALTGAPPARVVSLAGQALNGLEALASRGLAHHNVSPDNLFLVAGPQGEQVKLLGLGTAIFRPRGPAAASGVPTENARFRAPELAAGGAADWRADLFSLALTTCHALGATVGLGESPVVQLSLAVSFELDNDEALRQGLERSLRQRPGERPTPRDLRAALWMAAGRPAAPPVVAPVPASAPVQRPAAVPPAQPLPPIASVTPFPPSATQPSAPAPPVIPRMVAETRIPPAAPQGPTVIPSAAPVQRAAAPELVPPEPPAEAVPQEPGDVLSVVDEEVLNALLAVPPPPVRSPEAVAPEGKGKVVPFLRAAPPAPAAHPAGAPARPPLLRRPGVLGAVGGVLVLGILAIVWLLRPRPQPVPAPAPPPPPVVTLPKPPSEPPIARLEEAKLQLGQGDDLAARRVLRGISFGEQGLLSPGGCRELAAVEETLAIATLERLPADLANGLKNGDVELLQSLVDAGSGQEAGLSPEVRANFNRARDVVAAYAQVRATAAHGDSAQVLERFATVTALLPKASDPEDLRGKAATALETQAEALVGEAHYAEGLARLGPLQKNWPERTGLKERVTQYETFQRTETEQEAILAALPAIERRKKPWDGLQMLTGVEPTPHLAARFADVRKRLEAQMASLDQGPPKIVLRDGYLLEYDRGTVAELSFRATDDYEVKDVKVMARPQGGKFRELKPEKNRAGYYTVQIAPSFHQNGNVDLYVTATDLSGHEAALGSPDQPLRLKRKQGFTF